MEQRDSTVYVTMSSDDGPSAKKLKTENTSPGMSFNGKPLVNLQPIGDGKSFFVPDLLAQLGIDEAELTRAMMDESLYIPRGERAMQYRGKPIPRSKFFVPLQRRESDGAIPRYRYTGWTWRTMTLHRELGSLPAPFRALAAALGRVTSGPGGAPLNLTQAIGTLYASATDSIGWHADKMVDIAEPSWIVDVSLGEPRTFLLRRSAAVVATAGSGENTAAAEPAGEEEEERIPMPSGSAVLLSTETNRAYAHAVLAEPKAFRGPRVSLVFRNIKTWITEAQVREKIEQAERSQARAKGRGAAAAVPRGQGA